MRNEDMDEFVERVRSQSDILTAVSAQKIYNRIEYVGLNRIGTTRCGRRHSDG